MTTPDNSRDMEAQREGQHRKNIARLPQHLSYGASQLRGDDCHGLTFRLLTGMAMEGIKPVRKNGVKVRTLSTAEMVTFESSL